jgi:hypothetical protein
MLSNQINQQIGQCQQMIQQLVQQTEQASMMYQQLLTHEQQHAQTLEQMAQQERQAAQIIQNALQGHQSAIQRMNQVSQICSQLEQSVISQAQSWQVNNIHNQNAGFAQTQGYGTTPAYRQ